MTVRRRSRSQPLLNRVLATARDLAEQVRETAERVPQEANETHQLIEIARCHAERGRELSKVGREEARAVINSIKWGVDTANNGGARRTTKSDD